MVTKSIETPKYKIALNYSDSEGYTVTYGEDYMRTLVVGFTNYETASEVFEQKLVELQGH